MLLKDYKDEELENMTYDEIAYLILSENKKKEKLINLYKKVCKLLKLNFEEEQDRMVDFFEILSLNKKFIMLDNGYWDLQINHKVDAILEDIEDTEVEESDEELEEDEIEDEEDEEEKDDFFDEEDEDVDDELEDLSIISDDEEEASL